MWVIVAAQDLTSAVAPETIHPLMALLCRFGACQLRPEFHLSGYSFPDDGSSP